MANKIDKPATILDIVDKVNELSEESETHLTTDDMYDILSAFQITPLEDL